ncbi:hypothetical protein I7I53_01015 [Histoplasma capsulatum var. duboisii H88]|uniref:Uncharacterized protein n=1 Tax=Ajellomyces capsulatus (strain H88) TaxID=544711 RepID=A0A8A1LMM5_AJEC8|nr:hypothetical protein I7I53_01015 [Histoplasma capsulatum var. duboisii H88]
MAFSARTFVLSVLRDALQGPRNTLTSYITSHIPNPHQLGNENTHNESHSQQDSKSIPFSSQRGDVTPIFPWNFLSTEFHGINGAGENYD